MYLSHDISSEDFLAQRNVLETQNTDWFKLLTRRAALRQEANEALAAEVKARAADTLDKVLFELSSNMKNAYSRSDM